MPMTSKKLSYRTRIAAVFLVGLVLCWGSGRVFAIDPSLELRDLDVSNWDCLDEPEGTAKEADGAARNRMKNRDWIAVTTTNVPQWDYNEFVKKVQEFDAQLNARSRRDLTPSRVKKLAEFEKQIVSLTGYVVLTYPGPPESTNCGSEEFHDWHVELVPVPLEHPPRVGDPTAIICEVTPRTESPLYKSGVRLQKLAAFMRTGDPPNIRTFPTGAAPHKVRITGYLMWDDQHNQPGQDIGVTIQRGGGNVYHNPWRGTAWEIHPILKIEDLGAAR